MIKTSQSRVAQGLRQQQPGRQGLTHALLDPMQIGEARRPPA